MTDERLQHATVRLVRGYEFVAECGDGTDTPPIVFDEPAPLGEGHGPTASEVLGATVGNCLAASLALCMRKARIDVEGLTAKVTTRLVRNDKGRMRIGGIDVDLAPEVGQADTARLERCEQIFEDFCTVTASVRQGIPVQVRVVPAVLGERPRTAVLVGALDEQC